MSSLSDSPLTHPPIPLDVPITINLPSTFTHPVNTPRSPHAGPLIPPDSTLDFRFALFHARALPPLPVSASMPILPEFLLSPSTPGTTPLLQAFPPVSPSTRRNHSLTEKKWTAIPQPKGLGARMRSGLLVSSFYDWEKICGVESHYCANPFTFGD
ncbi:hypothetical protein FA13DRAFT_1713748 [Coprinellus micaceus]|uniref:Uncharacterized protein n=1 Tax=Coprinellus micaceus TaxID=71717 RepID=A0A4Y7SUX8_COPMI|nr:hypothetical protein FA13DRAFT_1713748 [Coprinellus micaceus]